MTTDALPFDSFLVGGAVRDRLLGLPVKDRDWVVVGATPAQMLAAGYRQVGADFPVFLHPQTQEEYALARTERKSGQGYKGFICDFSPDIPLEEDLRRRDLTINAMAEDRDGQLIDPHGGRRDLEGRWLRHVSDAFREDPLRVFRVARFAARLAPLGFRVAPETLALMRTMAESGELATLTRERVWQETLSALRCPRPSVYFDTLRAVDALRVWFPEVDALFGVPQRPEYHPEIDTGVHTLMVVDQAARLGGADEVRFAALVHDLGKALTPRDQWPRHIGHEAAGEAPVNTLCERLAVPRTFRDLALMGCREHLLIHQAQTLRPVTLLKLFDRCDLWRRPDRFESLLQVCEADARGRLGLEDQPYPSGPWLSELARQVRTVSARDLLAAGTAPGELPETLRKARLAVIRAWIATSRSAP